MSENKENKVKVENLPQAEQELSSEEAKQVKGGYYPANATVATIKSEEAPTAAREAGSGMTTGRRQYEP